MRDAQPRVIQREAYQPPDWWIDETVLDFLLEDDYTTVSSQLHLRRNTASDDATAGLQLDGEQLELLAVSIDGKPLTEQEYHALLHPM